MGNQQSGSGGPGGGGGGGDKGKGKEKKKYEAPVPTRVGKKKKRSKGPDAANKLPAVTPHTKCRLKLLKQERIKVRNLISSASFKFELEVTLFCRFTHAGLPPDGGGVHPEPGAAEAAG